MPISIFLFFIKKAGSEFPHYPKQSLVTKGQQLNNTYVHRAMKSRFIF